MMLIDGLLRLLFPPKCVLCGKLLQKRETDLCHRCRVEGPEYGGVHNPLPFIDGWEVIWYYEDVARESILRFKFSGARWQAGCYGRLLAMRLTQLAWDFDEITWVPTASRRQRKRGYDQVQLLADAVAVQLERKPRKLLDKIRNNPPQSGISGQAQRRANVMGAYRISKDADVKGKCILLLDDVITTGATASEAARVLLTAGAKKVYCAAMAKARHDG